jgi:hypothetical protein
MFSTIEYLIAEISFWLGCLCLLFGAACIFLDTKFRDTLHRSIFFYGLAFCLMSLEIIVLDEGIINQIQTVTPENNLFLRVMYIFMVSVTTWCFIKSDWTKIY